MSIKAEFQKEGDFKKELVPKGSHVARLYSIIHIGKIEEEYMGESRMMDKVMLRFELPNEIRTFGEKGELPMAISGEYTLSLGEKANLRKIVEGILGESLDETAAYYGVESLAGKTCLLNVIHKTSRKGNEYAQIASAMPLPKGMLAPDAINKQFIFDFEENYSDTELETMPDFLKEKIKSSEQYKKRFNGGEAHSKAIDDAFDANNFTEGNDHGVPF